MRRILIVVVIATLIVGCGQRGEAALDEQIDIGTHSLHMRCIGAGTPVVVIDAGLGESIDSWQPVQDLLAEETRVCAYERAGYGESEAGPLPRHSRRAAEELKLLLDKADVEGPYLLVGHSLGGLNMQLFASQYADDVAGAVLLDPSPLQWITGGGAFPELYELFEQQTQELSMAAAALSQSADPEERTQARFLEALNSEHAQLLDESAQQAAAIESFGEMPLVVIGSGKGNPAFGNSAAAFQQFWIEQSRELAGKSTNGRFVLAEESGHQIQQDDPDRVLDTIRDVLEQVR